MKKLLIASTALVATAGMAAADVTVTGHAAAGYHSNLTDNSGTGTYVDNGIYSNVGVDFAMSGATDGGLTFAASLNIDAGTEIDQANYEFDANDGGTAGLGSVTVGGAFGTLTFDNAGIDNLFDGDYSSHDVSLATTVNGIALTIAADADESVNDGTLAAGTDDSSMSAAYTTGAITTTVTASNHSTAGMSSKVNVAYVVSDALTVSGSTKSLSAGGNNVAEVKAVGTVNGVSVTVASDNATANGWDLDLGYTVSGVALAYGTDESKKWTLTASYDLGGGASFKAGVKNQNGADDSMYAGVSFAF